MNYVFTRIFHLSPLLKYFYERYRKLSFLTKKQIVTTKVKLKHKISHIYAFQQLQNKVK